jgi:hypothetical protein
MNKNCVTCLYWKGILGTNKCKKYPDIIPDWHNGCSSWYPLPDKEIVK